MRKPRSGKAWNWPIVCSSARPAIDMIRSLFIFIFLLCVFQPVAFADELKQPTVNDYLQQAKAQGKPANHLISESSPYLLQHAYNPVEWYAWGEEAFEKAKRENKPVFLSIGYSTCHWCHVMAQESFENIKIASLLNKYFVCIKVDREQRPDIDSIYMLATELISGHGGWPMTVFIDHELRPFHAATYYPPFTTDKVTGLEDVLLTIHELWLKQPEKIDAVATAVTARIAALADDTVEGGELSENIVELAMQQIIADYDEDYGGFSAAPKFPTPGIFSLLNQIAYMARESESGNKKSASVNAGRSQKMMQTTLDAMASGGIYDQLAGGFHRYSVDAGWQVPHFEKMLYSQALMVMAYIDFYRNEPQQKYKQVIYQTLDFVRAEMRSPAGGFYSALDADSERVGDPGRHAEGAYYLWRASELKKRLSADEFLFIKKYFHIDDNGNIASDPQNEFAGLNILAVDEDYRDRSLTQQQAAWLSSAKKKLMAQRQLRPRPHLDDKTITAWNGMMLAAFAKASVVFDDPALLQDALQTLAYIKKHLYSVSDSKLLRQYRDAKVGTAKADTAAAEAILADYAWVITGLLEVYQASNDVQWLEWAVALQEKQNEIFLDDVSGAYYESMANDASLLFRFKSIYDGVMPSPNAIAFSNLDRLSGLALTDPQRRAFSSQTDKLLSSFATAVNQNPAAAAFLLTVDLKRNEFTQGELKPGELKQ
jgi:uncharacterized protein